MICGVVWEYYIHVHVLTSDMCVIVCLLLMQSGRSLLVINFKFIFSHLVRNCSQKALSIASSFLKVCAFVLVHCIF